MSLKFEKPNTSLNRELLEVKSAAEDLESKLNKTNWLPIGFEREPLVDMLSCLGTLPAGTALAARSSLRAANAEIQNLEEQYFKTDSEISELDANDEQNFLQRRSELGRATLILKGTVQTALSICRRQSGETESDDLPPNSENRRILDPLDNMDARLLIIEQTMDRNSVVVDEILPIGFANKNLLKRTIVDTKNLSVITRSVLAMRTGSNWVWVGLSKTLKAAPRAALAVIKAIKKGNDISRKVSKRWNEFQSDFSEFVHDQIDKTADSIIASIPGNEDDEDEIPKDRDYWRKQARNYLLKREKVPDHIAVRIKTLLLQNLKYIDVGLLENFTELEHLNLGRTRVDNFEALSNLGTLKRLYLNYTIIADLKPLSNFKNLTRLEIAGTPIKTLHPISGLNSLKYLNITGTNVEDLSPIKEFHSLLDLFMSDTPIKDVSILLNLPSLQYVMAHNNKVKSWPNFQRPVHVWGRTKTK